MTPDSEAPGSSDQNVLSRWIGLIAPFPAGLRPQAPLGWAWRFGLAAAAAAAGLGLRLALTAWVGPGLPTYITFYPMVMAAALLAGFWPGLLATALSMLATALWILPPEGLAVESPVERLGLVIFAGMGLFMSAVAALYRRDRTKAAAYDREAALRESREALAQQREWLRVTLVSIGDAVLAADSSGKIAFINPSASELTGWPEAEAIGRPAQEVFRIVDEQTGAPGEDVFTRVLREGKVIALANHTALISRDGRQVPIEDSAAPIRDAAGVVTGAVLVFHDATDKRRAQEALRESEERVRRKLESILTPEGDVGHLELSDIIDAGAIQSLMDEFHKLVGVPMAIIDLKGKVLVGEGWQDICTQFHRVHPETCRNCVESDLLLTKDVPAGEFKLYKCKNHMWDVSTPIMIGERHVGNVFMGQFFFDDEQPDRELFRSQSRRYGFDEAGYLAALDRVPRLSREAVETGMRFFLKLARMISQLSYGNIKLARLLAERDAHEAELRKLNRALRAISNSNQAMLRAEDEGQYLREVCRIVSEDCGHAMVWIGYADDDEAKTVRPVAWAGMEAGYLATLQITWADTERGRGPTGTAIRTGRPTGCRNMLVDPAFAPWCEDARRRGYASSVVLPLLEGGKAFGAINVYSQEPDAFSEDETRLLAELAGDLSQGIAALRARAERARAEQALQAAHGKLAIAQQSAGAGAWDWDLATARLDWSPELYRLFGLDPSRKVADFDTWREIMHPDDRQAAEERGNAAIRDGTRLNNEYRVVLPSGEVRWISAVGETSRDGNGKAVRMSGLCFDITERKRGEEALASARAEAELRAAEVQTLLDAAPVAVWIAHDPRCLRITGNSYADALVMRVPRGANISASASPGDAATTYKAFRDGVELRPEELPAQVAAATGRPVANETIELRFPDGRVLSLLMSAVPLFDAHGRVRGAVATGMDISERKRAEENLRRSNWRNDVLAKTAGELLKAGSPQATVEGLCREVMAFLDCQAFFNFLADKPSGRLRLNACAGIPEEEAREIQWLDYGVAVCGCAAQSAQRIVAENIQETPDPRTELVKSYGIQAYACHPLMAQGEVLGTLSFGTRTRPRFAADELSLMKAVADLVSIAIQRQRAEQALQQHRERLEELVRERTNELERLVGTLREEIAERERAEAGLRKATEQLAHSQKLEAVGRLAGGVAHDFNNLMTVVTGYGRRVLRDGGLGAGHRSAVEQMTKAGEQAVNLTRQLLAFSRKQVINPVVLDLNETVDGMRKMLPTVLGEDIAVAFELQSDPWPVLADPTQIAQVIMNLAANARDAMPAGGRFIIRTANIRIPAAASGGHGDIPPGRYALLAVADTGAGLSAEAREHLFEPFFTTKQVGDGTGLGLSSVYGIVQQSGGHIRVDSLAGRGTTFSIYFPAEGTENARGATNAAPNEPKAATPRGSETILLLEDEPSVCQLLTDELQELGYMVLPCRTAGDAIRKAEAREGPVDLLLSDVVLPGVSGPTLVKMLKDRGKVKRVLFMSGHAEKHIVQRGILADGVDFIGKPFTAEALAAKIREVLDRKTAQP
ncbi:MAG TPA: PocR ligand-binding domain-containing protein [Planctomycetota bacterium]|nr:PocR ligand-binding domain-containing protein [Planctomycetota bacterium]